MVVHAKYAKERLVKVTLTRSDLPVDNMNVAIIFSLFLIRKLTVCCLIM